MEGILRQNYSEFFYCGWNRLIVNEKLPDTDSHSSLHCCGSSMSLKAAQKTQRQTIFSFSINMKLTYKSRKSQHSVTSNSINYWSNIEHNGRSAVKNGLWPALASAALRTAEGQLVYSDESWGEMLERSKHKKLSLSPVGRAPSGRAG